MSPAKTRIGACLPLSLPRALLFTFALVGLAACGSTPPPSTPPPIPAPQTRPVPQPITPVRPTPRAEAPAQASSFDLLAGWSQIDARGALSAFVQSCQRIQDRPDAAPMNPNAPYAGTAGDWRGACLQAAMIAPANPDAEAARAFFERNFSPLNWRPTGRLTGYYEPYLDVRAHPTQEFSMAIRALPDDLLTGDLGQFIAGLEGQRIVGRANQQRFEPYRTRREIEALNLGVPLAWGRPIDVFFLQIQGSGRLLYPDGSQARVRFAAHNGLEYVSIGRILIERGELSPHNASKQDIEDWLQRRGPRAWEALFNENPRYVFFTLDTLEDPTLGPTGAQGAPLTPMASLAIDPQYHAWGVPILLTADLPDAPNWTGLVISQDAGGAITGQTRGDLFYGWGNAAGARAGRQNDPDASWIILLPNDLANRLR